MTPVAVTGVGRSRRSRCTRIRQNTKTFTKWMAARLTSTNRLVSFLAD